MELKKLAPWNWFSKEEEREHTVPVHRKGIDNGPQSRNLTRYPHEFDSLFHNFFGNALREFPGFQGSHTPLGAYGLLKPQADLRAEEKQYILTVEIPGVTEKDVTINVLDNTMTIKGEKRQEQETKKENYYRIERSYGSFQRILSLPADVDQENIKASFQHGVLTVTMPRHEVTAPLAKPIEITSS